jgi:hypothetical protein
MPQLVKKRRSGWAVLAVGAMVASILAFGAAPAVAGVNEPDAEARYTACLGPALEANEFTDVSMGSVHYNNINCLAYYGITQGKTADTFDPSAIVTRSQMSLFLTRAASAAGVDLGDVMDEGFTDIDMVSADRRSAINRLAAKGIMEGRTATTFDPGGLVTRADMAQHIFAFLDLAVDTIVVDVLPETVDGDDAGIELLDDDGDGNGDLKAEFFDYFGDARRTVPAHVDSIIGAIYELGVTTGTNNRVGEHGTFEPAANVSRAQMASFIMRALGHTNLRPEGLTAQQTNDHIQVSVRSADFEPVINARVEAFSTGYADSAFNSSGRCIGRYVDVDPRNSGHDECEIDGGDPLTDVDGNAELQPGLSSSLPVITCTEGTPYWYNVGVADVDPATYVLQAAGISDPEADYMLWAWTGSFGDTVGADTELFEVVPANQLVSRTRARTAVFSGGTSHDVKMGQTLNYEIQLVNQSGRPVGPNPFDDVDGDQDYIVTIEKQRVEEGDDTTAVAGSRAIVSVTQMRPDDDGKFKIVVTNPDPAAGVPNDDVRVTVTVERAEGNNLRLVDATGTAMVRRQDTDAATADTGYDGPRIDGLRATSELFSDDAPVPTKISYARASWRQFVPGANNRNSLAVTVLDQYGNPDSDFVTATFADPNDSEAVTYTSGRNGRVNFSYNFSGSSASEMITLTGGAAGADQVATVHWARINGPGEGDAGPVLIADPSTSTFVVNLVPAADQDAVPVAYPFGADDEFVVVGEAGETEEEREKPLSVEQFLEVLSVANSPDPRIGFVQAGATLEWVGFDYDRPTDGATWILRGLTCRPPAGGDEEPALNSASPASPNEMPYS